MILASRFRRTLPEILVAFLALLAIAGVPSGCARAQDSALAVTELRIPTKESGYRGLEAVMVRPNDNAPHPLALMTHGTPRAATERPESTPLRLIPQAREFARRGWTAVIVMRRGFGDSGGAYAEDAAACGASPDFAEPTQEAAKDLRQAAAYLATRREVDGSRMIGVGVSTGGMAMLGLAADPPPGLRAAISFAGGRGSDAPDHVCNPDVLVKTVGDFGRRSKVPMLWVYAANDHFFGPQLAQQLYLAFANNGGTVRFIATGPFGADGHELFSQQGAPVWTPIVDDYLLGQNLALRDTPLPDHPPDMPSPSQLGANGRKQFDGYLLSAPHKAFATSQSGAFGFSYGQRTLVEAEVKALGYCARYAPGGIPCTLTMIDDEKAKN
jgi:dienelactone hydrolase